MNKQIRLGMAGCGYWGPNLMRNFRALPDCHLKMMCDLDTSRLRHLQTLYAEVENATDYAHMLSAHKPSNHGTVTTMRKPRVGERLKRSLLHTAGLHPIASPARER